MTEADTCREFVTPKLVEAGWGELLNRVFLRPTQEGLGI
jgi:hypothetical protein